jgi:hypothetical protein
MFLIDVKLGQKRYLGREKALVMDTRDPGQSGRIIVNSRTLGTSNWIPYVMAPGFFTPPKIGDWVYIECEDGLEWAPIAHGKVTNLTTDIISTTDFVYREVPTVAAWMSNGALDNAGNPPPAVGPTGFAGHAILLDDGQEVYGSAPNANPNAGIKIFSFGGNKIILNDDTTNKKILIADSANTSTPTSFNSDTGNRIVIDGITGMITISNPGTGTQITVMSGVINITSSGTVNVNSSGKTSVVASEIDLNIQSTSYGVDPGDIVTASSNPGLNVIDTIFGDPVMGVTTVKAGG